MSLNAQKYVYNIQYYTSNSIVNYFRAVDFINLKLYDFYGHWNDPIRAYPHSALTGENGLRNVVSNI